MKRMSKRIAVSLLSAVMAFSTMAISASAASISVPKSVTVYLNTGASITIQNAGTGKNKITKSSIKSSKKNVVEPAALSTNLNSYSYKSEPLIKGGQKYSSTSASNSQTIDLMVHKTGTSVVSYKIGSKTYTTKVNVLKYTNPVKSITLTGVNGGKNFASKTKNSGYASVKMAKKTQSKAWLTVSAASGWKIEYADISDEDVYYSVSRSKTPVSSVVLGAGSIHKGSRIGIRFVNPKKNASMYVSYDLE